MKYTSKLLPHLTQFLILLLRKLICYFIRISSCSNNIWTKLKIIMLIIQKYKNHEHLLRISIAFLNIPFIWFFSYFPTTFTVFIGFKIPEDDFIILHFFSPFYYFNFIFLFLKLFFSSLKLFFEFDLSKTILFFALSCLSVIFANEFWFEVWAEFILGFFIF